MASQWRTLQWFAKSAEQFVFNEAPKFFRQLQNPEALQRSIQQGIQQGLVQGLRMGMEVIAGGPIDPPQAITAGRPVTDRMVPTSQRARRIVYAPDLDGQADPGEIVWTWVVFEDDPTRGKDRPVLVVGRDRRTLLGLMLSSQDYHSSTTRPGWASEPVRGTPRAGRVGCGSIACSTCPRKASGARAPSSSVARST